MQHDGRFGKVIQFAVVKRFFLSQSLSSSGELNALLVP